MAKDKKIILVSPRGFCAGVVRAIDVVKIALDLYGAPIYVRKEIVHNRHVVEELRQAGAIFVDELADAPTGCASDFQRPWRGSRQSESKRRSAGCTLSTHVSPRHQGSSGGRQVRQAGLHDHPHRTQGSRRGYRHAGRSPEVIGTRRDCRGRRTVTSARPGKICFLTQTTLSLDETRGIVEALRAGFPGIKSPPASGYLLRDRKPAAGCKSRRAAKPICCWLSDHKNSSNSMRLVEVCKQAGVPAYLVDDFTQVQEEWLAALQNVAVTAGASAPEYLVEQIAAFLRDRHGFNDMEEVTLKDEDVRFSLPAELDRRGPAAAHHRRTLRDHMRPQLQTADALASERFSGGERASDAASLPVRTSRVTGGHT